MRILSDHPVVREHQIKRWRRKTAKVIFWGYLWLTGALMLYGVWFTPDISLSALTLSGKIICTYLLVGIVVVIWAGLVIAETDGNT